MDKVLQKQATIVKGLMHFIELKHVNEMHGAGMILAARKAIYESSGVRKNWEAWVEALESGNYLQDADGGVLNRDIGSYGSAYCCLGVACDLQGVSWRLDKTNNLYTYSNGNGPTHDCLPDHNLMNKSFGVIKETDSDGGQDIYLIVKYYQDGKYHHTLTCATALNDDGVSFDTIAQAIRNTYLNPVDERLAKGL